MSKIIFVNRFFYPDQSATSQLLTDLATKLDFDANVNIVVITSRRVMADPRIRLDKNEVFGGVQINRVYTTSFGKKRLLGRMLDFLFFYVTAFFKLLVIAGKDDVVVVKTDPPFLSVISMFAVKLKRAKQINWLQDIYPEVASRLGIKIFDGVFGRVMVGIRNYSLRKSWGNVVLGEVMASHVESMGVDKDKIHIIHNWSDGNIIKPIEKKSNYLIKEWALEDKFVVCYSGNMGRAHEFDTILKAIENLSSYKEIVFLFIGDGAKRQWLEDQARQKKLENVFFKPYQDFSKLSYSLSVGDIHLISLIPELEGLIVPSKLYGVMAAGRPSFFVGAKNAEIKKILEENNCGRSFLVGEPDNLVSEILAVKEDKSSLRQMSESARSEYMRKYDKPVALKHWQVLLNNAVDKA